MTEVKTFPVPFPLRDNQGNITINTNTSSKYSKEQTIKHLSFIHKKIFQKQQNKLK